MITTPYKDPEQKRIYDKEFQKEYSKRLEVKKKRKEELNIWRLKHPQHYKKLRDKQDARRRELGSILLNEPFSGSDGHHLDKMHIVYIPESLHESIRHNVYTGYNMDVINAKVYQWLGYIPL